MSKGLGETQRYLLSTMHQNGGQASSDRLSDCFFDDARYDAAFYERTQRDYLKERLRSVRRAMTALAQRGLVERAGKTQRGPFRCRDEDGYRGYRREQTIWALTQEGCAVAAMCDAHFSAEFEKAQAAFEDSLTDEQRAEQRESVAKLRALLVG